MSHDVVLAAVAGVVGGVVLTTLLLLARRLAGSGRDLGSDEDVEGLRNDLAALLTGLDDYVEVVDPLTTPELGAGQLSGDIADIASALLHGLRHYADGHLSEALWWWQFSYLSAWGGRAASALRVLQSVLSHIRLDADEDVVAEAQFDALHGG